MSAAGHRSRLDRMRRDADRLGAIVYAASDEIRVEARRLITAGSVSGKNHVASRPGEPPNRDTGHLDTNIENTRTAPLEAEVRSKAQYAAALEYGTSKMAERPYMRPAVRKVKPKMLKDIETRVNRAIRGR